MIDYSREKRVALLNKADDSLTSQEELRRDANAINLTLDTPIFRIFRYERFIELLKSGKNTLVRPSAWEDPFENALFNHQYIDATGKEIDMSSIRDSWYGQCWTDKEAECDGLWRVYSENGQCRCVRVKTTVRKIFEPFYDGSRDKEWQCFIGKVDYSDEDLIVSIINDFAQALATDTTNVNQMQLLLTKRKEFSYESEVRLLYCKGVDKDNHDIVYQYTINPNEVFEEVLLDPWCPDRLVRNYKDELYNAGYHGDVRKSQLYAPIKLITKTNFIV